MNRRQLLRSGAVVIGAGTLSRILRGQDAPASPQQAGSAVQGDSPQPRSKPSGNFPLDVYSRELQWLRTPQDVAAAVTDIGLHSVDLTVMPYPGHVDPA